MATTFNAPTSRHSKLILGLVILGVAFYVLSHPALKAAQKFLFTCELSRDAETLHHALVEARATALRTGQTVGVNVDSSGWMVFEDTSEPLGEKGNTDEVMLSRAWSEGTKWGSNIPAAKD